MAFSSALRKYRKQDGLTQLELAEKMGLSKSAISMYECGRREADYETLEAFADFFNVSIDNLLDKDEAATVFQHGLSPTEIELIMFYREAPPEVRRVIDSIVRG